MRHIAIAILLLSLCLPSVFVHAQEAEDVVLSGIIISADPEFPAPGSVVTARATSYTVDLDVSTLTWTVNGKSVASGKGIKSVELITNLSGNTIIGLKVDSPDGTFNRTLTLEGNTVDLLWQGEGYVPPFYKNRTLWGYETRLTLVAIPHVTGKTPKELIYRWTLNNEVQGSSSGVGKDTFMLFDSILGLPQEITVEIMTDRDTIVASASITLQSQAPEILIYENNPALGFVFEREIGSSVTLKSKEISFSAFPLYFGVSQRSNSSLIYNWLTNSRDSRIGANVTYRVPDGRGTSNVSIAAKSVSQVLQTADRSFLVKFDNENSI
jgi:hypothetical protein